MAVEERFSDRLSQSQRAVLRRYRTALGKVGRAIWNDRGARIGMIILVAFVLTAVFAPQLAPHDPNKTFKDEIGRPVAIEPPSFKHPLGTTHLGRDVFSQWVFGARVSLIVGVLSGLSVMIIGTSVGLTAGYFKGKVDLVLMRVVDILYGIPATPLVLVLALFFGASLWNIILAFVFILWRTMARITRSQTLSLSERPFVKAAKATGASDLRIMTQHLLPNLLPLIFIETTIIIGVAIMLEAGLSFLGMGAENMISWGTMLQLTFATGAIREAWWWVLPPGISITLLILSFYYVSRALEEVTNPEISGGIR